MSDVPVGATGTRPGARRFLGQAWDVYVREILLVLPATAALRVSVSLATVVLVEIVVTALHLASLYPAGVGYGDGGDLPVMAALATVSASFGHHLLAGVLERVVGAERHGHAKPGIRETFGHLPWGRLVVADLVLTTVGIALLAVFVVPGLLVIPFLACVMPLLSMRHENLRTVWRASFGLVRGHWLAVALSMALAWLVEMVVLEGGALLVGHLTESHVIEVVAHGLIAIVVLPFGALVPVVITFDLLERRGEVPVERF